jgi:hypothetical protein
MTALIRLILSRLLRWFKFFSSGNKVTYRWYETDSFGL